MYVCVQNRACVTRYTHVGVCVCVCMCVCVCVSLIYPVCACVCKSVQHTHVRMYVSVCVCECMCVWLCLCVCVRVLSVSYLSCMRAYMCKSVHCAVPMSVWYVWVCTRQSTFNPDSMCTDWPLFEKVDDPSEVSLTVLSLHVHQDTVWTRLNGDM